MKDHTSRQLERAKNIRVDALQQAGKQIDKSDKKFAKGETDADLARRKSYEKASKESDPRDSNVAIDKADKNFVEDRTKAAQEHKVGYEKVTTRVAEKAEAKAKNRDPLTDAPGSHPIGTGIGSLGGAAAGAAAGSLAGPIGTLVGGVVGAIAGAAAGHSAGEAISPTIEEAYWRSAFGKEPYINKNLSFDDYAPAYRAGYMGREEYRDLTWEKAEPHLAAAWEKGKGTSRLQWQQARVASRAAWQRVDRPVA